MLTPSSNDDNDDVTHMTIALLCQMLTSSSDDDNDDATCMAIALL
jgi:hypothetical protein